MKKYIYVVILVSLSTLVVAKNDYKEAAKPYIGTTIKILDERSDITDHLQELVPLFIKEAGINVDYRILGHFERLDYWGLASTQKNINDAATIHFSQMGYLLSKDLILPLDDLMDNKKRAIDQFNSDRLKQDVWDMSSKDRGKTYGFVNWTYINVLMTRGDLINHPLEKEAFAKRYGYPLSLAQTSEQLFYSAEFFTRHKEDQPAGEP